MQKLDGQLITVFGGSGFLGRYVVQRLLARGARVRVGEREPRKALFLKPLGGLGQTQFVAADVTMPDTVARAVEGSDLVVNLAGTFGSNMRKVHVDGARNVARSAAAAGAEALVHISALGADMDSPSNYGRTKGEGERAVLAAFPQATILRPSVLFGREDAFVNRFAGMIAAAPVVPVLRAGAKFQPAYVTDVAQAVLIALADPARHGGRTYELGGPDVIAMGELLRWIARAIGRDARFMELPDALGGAVAMFGMLPGAPITQDQWRMLQRDNIVSPAGVGFDAFGVTPTPLATVAPSWLVRFRRHGRFGRLGAAA